jgi:HK97 gp10 family phage protein
MRTATMIIQRDAKIGAPVDTGRLRASITPSVADLGDVVQGVVGSNVTYAPYMELGTRPHWPPISALEVWARRHGTEPYLVARAIARRGTAARKFLQNAMTNNKERIFRILSGTIKRTVEGKG